MGIIPAPLSPRPTPYYTISNTPTQAYYATPTPTQPAPLPKVKYFSRRKCSWLKRLIVLEHHEETCSLCNKSNFFSDFYEIYDYFAYFDFFKHNIIVCKKCYDEHEELLTSSTKHLQFSMFDVHYKVFNGC